jgi:hypothetical protein
MATNEPVGDWTVTDPYGGQTHIFTSDVPAFAYAVHTARSDRATLITAPDGVQTLVLRVDPRVQIQAVRPLTGGGR